jgi:hypothetical protein
VDKKRPEWYVWRTMIVRCTYKSHDKYKYYGGRGISVCARWLSFDNFIVDMGPRPSAEYQIDRIDNDKDYSPENCRWLTRRDNIRRQSQNRLVPHYQEIRRLSDAGHSKNEIARLFGTSHAAVLYALNKGGV